MLENEKEQDKLTYIYEKYKPLMLMHAMKILKNEMLADDAIHDTIISIIKHKEKYLSDSCPDLAVPIVIIVKNKCYDILKRSGYSSENIDDHEHYLENDDISMDNKIISKEEYEYLQRCILCLDESSKNILEMRYVLGMSHKEISEITKISLGNINKKITRAKAKIREYYAEGCD